MRHAHYKKLAARLRNLLAQVEDRLADKDRDTVEEYIGVNEFGLALDHLAYALAEGRCAVSEDERSEILAAADLMGIRASVTQHLDPIRGEAF